MTTIQALPYCSTLLDDALSAQTFNSTHIPPHTILLGWQCGFEPMFFAVHSYLPNTLLDVEEAIAIALDYLNEKKWFDGSNRDYQPDYVLTDLTPQTLCYTS